MNSFLFKVSSAGPTHLLAIRVRPQSKSLNRRGDFFFFFLQLCASPGLWVGTDDAGVTKQGPVVRLPGAFGFAKLSFFFFCGVLVSLFGQTDKGVGSSPALWFFVLLRDALLDVPSNNCQPGKGQFDLRSRLIGTVGTFSRAG